jgi:ABC-type nickel/cobalt efflux system permease component RcnA
MYLLQSHLGQPAWKWWSRMIFILVLAIGCWWGYYKLRQILQSSAATGNPDRLDSVR